MCFYDSWHRGLSFGTPHDWYYQDFVKFENFPTLAREKQGVADISKTKRDSDFIISSTPTNVMILHTLVPSFAILLLS